MDSPLAPHVSTPAELRERMIAGAAGEPFLVLRDGGGVQMLLSLHGRERVTVGRRPECDVALVWDGKVSRLHAELQRVGGDWVIVDDGLSSNGTWLGERRLVGRSRLRDGDLVRCGGTVIAFCSPDDAVGGTAVVDGMASTVKVTPAQRRVLVALCAPSLRTGGPAVPPTNPEIAATLVVSVDAVKTQVRALIDAFGLDDLPQGQKRAALIERAIRLGVVTDRDLTA